MTPAQTFASNGIKHIIDQLGSPYFTWKGQQYNCIGSISQFYRELEEGGFTTEQLLTMTVPLFDNNNGRIFTGENYPQAQQKIVFKGLTYRIQNVKQDSILEDGTLPTRLRIVATCDTKGL